MATFYRKKKCKHVSQVLLIVGLGVPLAHVHAEYPDESVFANAVEVDDSELAEMRGKFVSPGQITYFGVQMQTQWTTGSGEVLSAGMKMDMNFPKAGNKNPVVTLVPTVSIVRNANTNTPEANSIQPGTSNTTITSNGLTNVSGVVQSIQEGGNQNSVNNDIKMNVTITSGALNGKGASHAPALKPSSVEKSAVDGSVALAGASKNGIEVYTYVPNQGEILQRIGGGPAGAGNIIQSARLVGDEHKVINKMTISATFSPVGANTVNNAFGFSTHQFDPRIFY